MPATDMFETKFQFAIDNGGTFGYYMDAINPYWKVMLNLASHFTRMAPHAKVSIVVQKPSLNAQ